MKIERKTLSVILRIGALGLIVGAVFSIANGDTLLGIGEFFAAGAWILAAKKVSGKKEDADRKQSRNTLTIIGSISMLISLLGIAGILNHILNTGESLLQPICIALFGAVAAGIAFGKRRNANGKRSG